MSDRADFAPCPICKQYSHSIGEDALAAAFKHFQSMYAHPVRGHPMGNNFDEKTRDAAQVLMAAARASLPADKNAVERVEQEISAWAFAHGIDGAVRNDLFKRLRAIAALSGHGE